MAHGPSCKKNKKLCVACALSRKKRREKEKQGKGKLSRSVSFSTVVSEERTFNQNRPAAGEQEDVDDYSSDDAQDSRGPRSAEVSSTRVTEQTGRGEKPVSFDTISPFGATKPESKRTWFVVITLIGILALGVIVYLFKELLGVR